MQEHAADLDRVTAAPIETKELLPLALGFRRQGAQVAGAETNQRICFIEGRRHDFARFARGQRLARLRIANLQVHARHNAEALHAFAAVAHNAQVGRTVG